MTDLEILKSSQDYIEKLARGIDPLSGEEITDDSLLNNIKISRCLYYVNDILKKVIDNKGKILKRNKIDFKYDEELIKNVYISPNPITLSQIIRNVKDAFNDVRLTFNTVASILYDKGVLIDNPNGTRPKKVANPNAEEMGVWSRLVIGTRGEYYKTVYGEQAQKYVLECLKEIQ